MSQLKLFQTNKDSAKISKLVRSDTYHETGLSLAKSQDYDKVSLVIDLFYYWNDKINLKEWAMNRFAYHCLLKFRIFDLLWSIHEIEAHSFYLAVGKNEEELSIVQVKIFEWQETTQWGDFNLAKLVDKYIKANRISFDDIIKKRFNN